MNQNEEHIAELIVALGDLEIGTRWDAATKLSELGGSVVPALLDLLETADWSVKHIAIWILGEIGDRQAVETIIGALDDSHLHVRLSAARALEKSTDPRAVLALQRWLQTDQSGR